MPTVVAAPDKRRSTATAAQLVGAIAKGAKMAGWEAVGRPMADGGEGTLDALGLATRNSFVAGPDGLQVDARWSLQGQTAVIEMAEAAGLSLAGGKARNDPLGATTKGVGELIVEAVGSGARHIIVGLGGSATTDGGWGAVEVIASTSRLHGVEIEVACDVQTTFVDAARVFAPQKGATSQQVELLTRRLQSLVEVYKQRFGVDVSTVPGSGAAGGLAGGLVALGARLVPGVELIAEYIGLEEAIEGADAVITGEGMLDAQSFNGKVVGGVIDMARAHLKPAMIVCGQADGDISVKAVRDRYGSDAPVELVVLADQLGIETSISAPLPAVTDAVRVWLSGLHLA